MNCLILHGGPEPSKNTGFMLQIYRNHRGMVLAAFRASTWVSVRTARGLSRHRLSGTAAVEGQVHCLLLSHGQALTLAVPSHEQIPRRACCVLL